MTRSRKWPWFVLIPTLLLVAVGLTTYFIDADLISFFLPTRELAVAASLVGAVTIGVAIRLTHRRIRSWSGLAVAILLLVGAGVFVREFTEYHEMEISFQNAGDTLAGTLYLPAGDGPFPAVVIAQGSIRAPRRLYHFWADHLVRRGIAVLNFDKRGTGRSGGTYQANNNASEANLQLLASDVVAGVEMLRSRPEIATSRIGIFGLSMGGWLAPIAAQRSPDVAFTAINSGPTVSVGEEGFYSQLAGDTPRRRSEQEQAQIDSLVNLEPPSGFDPRPLLAEQRVPGYWQLGALDSSIPTAKSVVVLDSLMASGRPFSYSVYPGADHLGFEGGWPLDLPEQFIDDLTDWILSQ